LLTNENEGTDTEFHQIILRLVSWGGQTLSRVPNLAREQFYPARERFPLQMKKLITYKSIKLDKKSN